MPPPSEREPTLRSSFVFNAIPLPDAVDFTKNMSAIKDQKGERFQNTKASYLNMSRL